MTDPIGTVTACDHHSLVTAFLTEHANASVCSSAAELAVANDQPGCDDRSPGGMTQICVLDKSDPRQLGLIKTLQATESRL
ncbi:hypothetical protein [Janthinobacterium sp. 64]|uniref:hypothetical protein n=1 Tax=Janthinobacterium sp. 64 TaxID=2035208 RepID=UPI000C2B6C73|nr:hypothetical protein [Janthinobacterium sp. 64]PKB21487.1 hypothetical protein CLU91_1867 [Janthinobacterium sp. 64]